MRKRWVSGVVIAASVVAAAAIAASPAQNPPPPWGTDGTVYALAAAGPNLYVGGDFTQVAPATGPLVALSRQSGKLVRSFPRVSGGVVSAVIADGRGGWFIGGDFDSIGNFGCARLARLTGRLEVDRRWCPTPDGWVRALVLDGGRLFVGGYFHKIGGALRPSLAALDSVTGKLLPWRVALQGGPAAGRGAVDDLAVHGEALYVLGFWDNIAGTHRPDLAAVDTSTGRLLDWDPAPPRIDDGSMSHDLLPSVEGLEPGRGALFVSGEFDRIGGAKRTYIAALDYATGRATPWQPPPSPIVAPGYPVEQYPRAMAVHDGRLFIGGAFRRIGGRARSHLAALDETTGALLPWRPRWSASSTTALAVIGEDLYAAGRAASGSGSVLGAFDALTAARRSWNAERPGEGVDVIAASGTHLLVGGSFGVAGGVLRRHLAAIDLRTGRATAWSPDVGVDPSAVGFIAVQRAGVVAAGSFTRVGRQVRRGLAVISVSSGRPTWRPPPNKEFEPYVYEGASRCPCAALGRALYVAVPADRGPEKPRADHIVAFDIATGRRTGWSADVGGTIEALSAAGGSLYAAVSRGQPDPEPVYSLASIDVRSREVTDWADIAGFDTEVTSLVVAGGRLYVAGTFDRVDRVKRDGLASFALRDRTLTPWHPTVDRVGGSVEALAATPSAIYVGGVSLFAAFDPRSGRRLKFDAAPLTSESSVYALLVHDGYLYVGGSGELGTGGLFRFRTTAR